MAITIKLDAIMSRYGIPLAELAEIVGITNVNLSRIRTGKAVSIRFSTLNSIVKGIRRCGFVDCDVADILGYCSDEDADALDDGKTSDERATR